MSVIIDYFDIYRGKFNWSVIAIHKNSKVPVFKNWQNDYCEALHRMYVKSNSCNIGILLGDVIDVESDTVEGNNLLNEIIGNYRHMHYRSEKSIHHLFINPVPDLTRTVRHGVEFRAKNHQSLLPPSTNKNGVRYGWMPESSLRLTPMPLKLLSLIRKPPRRSTWAEKSACCCVCGTEKAMPKARHCLEIKVFKKMNLRWQCKKCRTVDIRHFCKKVR